MSDLLSRRDFWTSTALASVGLACAAEPKLVPAPSDTPRQLLANGADLGSLFSDVQMIADANTYAYSFLSDRFKTLDDFKTAARAKILDVLNYQPDKVDPKPAVLERVERDDHVREKILFNTTPFFRVPAYVLIPKKLKKPAPAIVDLHSHGGMFLFGKEKVIDLGNNHAAMVPYHERNYDGRPTATALVRRGYVVISIDAFMFGERRILMDADRKLGWDRSKYSLDDVKNLNQVCRSKESTIAKALVFAGASWPGIVFWDDIRTVDYLCTRGEVDPKRIGCLGISMGGYRSIYLSALDERIKAACITGFMSSVRPMIKAHIDTHSWVHFLPGLHRWLDLPDVATLAAPRALLVQQCSQDRLFPPEGMKESATTIEKAFHKAGVKEMFAGQFHDAPHQFTKGMQDEAFAWFDKHLEHRGP
jgi:dienelactone hydrolase